MCWCWVSVCVQACWVLMVYNHQHACAVQAYEGAEEACNWNKEYSWVIFLTENQNTLRSKLNLHLKWDSSVCIKNFEYTFLFLLMCLRQLTSNSASSQKTEPVLWLVLGKYCWRSLCFVVCVFYQSPDWFNVQPLTDLQKQQHLNRKVCTFWFRM